MSAADPLAKEFEQVLRASHALCGVKLCFGKQLLASGGPLLSCPSPMRPISRVENTKSHDLRFEKHADAAMFVHHVEKFGVGLALEIAATHPPPKTTTKRIKLEEQQIATLNLDPSSIRLSTEARAALRTVNSLETARMFFDVYGSHAMVGQLCFGETIWAENAQKQPCIIHRGTTASFKPAWELIKNDPELKDCAHFLQDCFLAAAVAWCQKNSQKMSGKLNDARHKVKKIVIALQLHLGDISESEAATKLLLVSNAVARLCELGNRKAAAQLLTNSDFRDFCKRLLQQKSEFPSKILEAIFSPEAVRCIDVCKFTLDDELRFKKATPPMRASKAEPALKTLEQLLVELKQISKSSGDQMRNQCLKLIDRFETHETNEKNLRILDAFKQDLTAHTRQGIDNLIALLKWETRDPSSESVSSDQSNPSPVILAVYDLVCDGWSLARVTKDRNNSCANFSPEENLLNKIMQRCGSDIFGLDTKRRSRASKNPWATEASQSTTAATPAIPQSVAHTLIALMHQLSFPARAIVCRQLLDQRLAFPLFTKRADQVLCHAQALRYSPVLIDVDKSTNLLFNTDLPRIAVLCDQTPQRQQTGEVTEKIFGLKLFAASSVLDDVWLGEIGLGVCHGQVVIILSVFGDIQPVLEFVDSWADLVLVETDDTIAAPHKTLRAFAHTPNFSLERICAWTIATSPLSVDSIPVGTERTALDIAELLFDFVFSVEKLNAKPKKPRVTLEDLLSRFANLKCDIVKMGGIRNQLQQHAQLGVQQLVELQRSFTRQQHFLCEADNAPANQPFQRVWAKHKAKQELNLRLTRVTHTFKQPAIQLFLHIIAQDNHSVRATALLEFEEILSQLAFHVETDTFLQPEHIWREIALIFASDPTKFEYIADLAARVMLDGFALELVDGESCAIVKPWIDALITALNERMCRQIGKDSARVVALSTFGEQSCGKSTLLNVGFGTRLRASVDRCTRGVNFQIIARSGYDDGPNGADFIVLLDTEGIRAPGFEGTPAAVKRDNFLAMLAVVSADACMMLIRGESTQAMEQTIPLVVLGMESSKEVADATARGSASQLFAAFTVIDRNSRAKNDKIASDMAVRMRSAVADAVALAHEEAVAEVHTTSLLSSFNQDAITFVGSYKVDRTPIKDEPVTDYGLRVHQMLQGALERTVQARTAPATLQDWSCKLMIALGCAKSARWRAQLSDIKATRTAKELDELMLSAENCVAQKYSEQFDVFVTEMRQSSEKPDVENYESRLKVSVSEIETTQRETLHQEMETRNISGQQLQDRLQCWDSTISALQKRWCTELRQSHENIFSFECVANNFKLELQFEIRSKHRAGDFKGKSELQHKDEFTKLFDNMLREADDKNPRPISDSVKTGVRDCYSRATRLTAADFDTQPNTGTRFYWSEWAFWGGNQNQELIPSIIAAVEQQLQSVHRFEESAVTDMVTYVTKKLSFDRITDDTLKRQVHVEVCRFLENHMQKKQRSWEETNNIRRRLESSRAEMQAFFSNTLQDLNVTDLLAKTLSDGIKIRLEKSARDFIAAELANELVSKSAWVKSATALRAEVDLALVEAAEQGFEKLWPLIENPSEHFEKTVNRLIRHSMTKPESRPIKFLRMFVANIKQQLQQAARKTTMKDVLHFLKGCKEACLFETAAGLSPKTFEELAPENVSSAVNRAIEMIESVTITCDWDKILPPMVVELWKSNKFASGTARITCFDSCPMCGLTCDRPLGHDEEGGDSDKSKHHCRHQPAGLIGINKIDSQQLVWKSCASSAAEDDLFTFGSDEEFTRYQEFNSRFPAWNTPIWNQLDDSDENVAREYIFFKFNKEIAAEYELEPTPQEHLTKYNKPLNVVQAKLKARAQRTQPENKPARSPYALRSDAWSQAYGLRGSPWGLRAVP